MSEVVSLSRAAEQLGVERRTVSDVLRLAGMDPVPHPSNGSAKGVTPDQMKVVKKVRDYARAQGRDKRP